MQKKVFVIGGGFAGLTAAAYLANNNFKITLLESSPKLGGRAYSFLEKESGTIIDNGQHILMGCYEETLNFLKMIGATGNFDFQKQLHVNFVKENFEIVPMRAFPFFYPINLLIGLMNFKAVGIYDRLRLLKVFFKLPFISPGKYSGMNIKQWLEAENQSQELQDSFWKILAVGALNTSIRKASAEIFIDILNRIFSNGSRAAAIVLPKYGLSESYCKNAEDFIINRGGEIKLSEGVAQLVISDGMISEIQTAGSRYTGFDFVVTAIPAYALSKIINAGIEFRIPELTYSSILNIHLWHKDNSFPPGFYGLIDSPLHWVFNKGTHLNIVISDADELVKKSDEEIIAIIKSEMKKFFLLDPAEIEEFKIIKEKRATFIPSDNALNNRPVQQTGIKNLILAGDWVDTGLPSTIESAVKSGRVAAEIILSEKML